MSTKVDGLLDHSSLFINFCIFCPIIGPGISVVSPFWLSLVSVKELHCAMGTPVTCYLSRKIHTEKRYSEIACGCQCTCVCVRLCACVCAFIVGRQYLLDQTSSGSSVNSMASHHTETQSAGHIYYSFNHFFTILLIYFPIHCPHVPQHVVLL